VDEDWNQLAQEMESNRDQWDSLLKAKLKEWKEMKSAGILDKIKVDEDITEETIEEMDAMASKLLRKRKPENPAESIYNRLRKLAPKTLSSTVLVSMLNEMKDKCVYDTNLAEELLLNLARFNSSASILSAFNMYQSWITDKRVPRAKADFYISFLSTAISNNHVGLSFNISKQLIQSGVLTVHQLLPVTICIECCQILPISLYKSNPKKLFARKSRPAVAVAVPKELSSSDGTHSTLISLLALFERTMAQYSTKAANVVLFTLSKRRLLKEVLTPRRIRGPITETYVYFVSTRCSGYSMR